MKTLNKKQFQDLANKNPQGGIVFSVKNLFDDGSELLITGGKQLTMGVLGGSILELPYGTLPLIDEYPDDTYFTVYSHMDVLCLIKILSSQMKCDLKDYFEECDEYILYQFD